MSLATLLSLAAALNSTPSVPEKSPDPAFTKGAHTWSYGVSYGAQHRIFGGDSSQDFVMLVPRWMVNLTGQSGRKWTRGTLSLGIEGMFGKALGPDGEIWSAGPLLRYSFPSSGKVTPFLEVVHSFFYMNAPMPELPVKTNFTVQGGLGGSVRMNSRDRLELIYRFHHISNAGQRQPNRGVNSSFIVIGYARHF